MIDTAPRVIHNENLAKAFFSARGIESSFPPIFQQLESVVINRNALFKFGYNGSIIRHKDRIFLAYRYHTTNTPASELAIAELDEKFNVRNNRTVKLFPSAISTEDPRLFVFKSEIYINYVESSWPVKATSVVKYGLLVEDNPWKIVDIKQPEIGRNDGNNMQKNWVIWEQDGDLLCLYQSQPDQIIYNLSKDKVEYVSDAPHWPYGEIRGGVIIGHEDKLLRFFHSRLNNEPAPSPWRYYLGCALMESKPPFRTIAVSKEPLVRASEICDLSMEERNKCGHYKPSIIFPMGIIEKDGARWLSAGTNDSGIVMLKITDFKL